MGKAKHEKKANFKIYPTEIIEIPEAKGEL